VFCTLVRNLEYTNIYSRVVGGGGGGGLVQRCGGNPKPLRKPLSHAELCNCYTLQELLNVRRNIDRSSLVARRNV
jgi:hypothetical protein